MRSTRHNTIAIGHWGGRAIESLDLPEQRRILEILELKIFEAEEDLYEDDAETIAEIRAARAEYEAGNYQTEVYRE